MEHVVKRGREYLPLTSITNWIRFGECWTSLLNDGTTSPLLLKIVVSPVSPKQYKSISPSPLPSSTSLPPTLLFPTFYPPPLIFHLTPSSSDYSHSHIALPPSLPPALPLLSSPLFSSPLLLSSPLYIPSTRRVSSSSPSVFILTHPLPSLLSSPFKATLSWAISACTSRRYDWYASYWVLPIPISSSFFLMKVRRREGKKERGERREERGERGEGREREMRGWDRMKGCKGRWGAYLRASWPIFLAAALVASSTRAFSLSEIWCTGCPASSLYGPPLPPVKIINYISLT